MIDQKTVVQVAMNGYGVLGRRGFLKGIGLGAAQPGEQRGAADPSAPGTLGRHEIGHVASVDRHREPLDLHSAVR